MSWQFPKRVPRENHPLSPEDLAEGLRPFYEISGNINEHNVDASSITTGLTVGVDTENDLAYRIKEVNNYSSAALFDAAERRGYQITAGWVEVADSHMEFSTEGGPFLLFAAVDYSMATTATRLCQAQFVILLNGSPYIETGIGCFDTSAISGVHELGLAGAASRACIDSILVLPSGKHRVSIGVGVRAAPAVEGTGGPILDIRNSQLICVELAR
tara:strand:+ start:307 stop:951 length:645 start_codon:yes stop_codon:yes gene_type:complete